MRLSLPAGDRASRHFPLLLAAVAALALGGATACNGGDTLTEADAEAIAAEALLVVGDLPVGSWDEQESQPALGELFGDTGDRGESLGTEFPAECDGLLAAITDLASIVGDREPLAVASRSFTSGSELFEVGAIASSVLVFAAADRASDALDALDEALDADRLEACVLATADLGEGEGFQITDFKLLKPDYALDGSVALRLEIRAVALILPIAVDVDLHAFQRNHVLAILLSAAINGDHDDEADAALLDTFEDRVVDAQN